MPTRPRRVFLAGAKVGADARSREGESAGTVVTLESAELAAALARAPRRKKVRVDSVRPATSSHRRQARGGRRDGRPRSGSRVSAAKAKKTTAEVEGMRRAHHRDGVAPRALLQRGSRPPRASGETECTLGAGARGAARARRGAIAVRASIRSRRRTATPRTRTTASTRRARGWLGPDDLFTSVDSGGPVSRRHDRRDPRPDHAERRRRR